MIDASPSPQDLLRSSSAEATPAALSMPSLMRIATHALTILLAVVAFVAVVWYARELLLVIQQAWILWLTLLILVVLLVRSLVLLTRALTQRFTQAETSTRITLVIALLLYLALIALAAAHVLRLDPFREQAGEPSSVADAFSQISFKPESINETLLKLLLHQQVNEERAAAGRILLKHDAALAAIAQAHSDDMVARKFFEHENPDGRDAIARGKQAGYNCTKRIQTFIATGIGENLARTPLGNSAGCGKVYTEKALVACTVKG